MDTTTVQHDRGIAFDGLRALVRSTYDLQQLRIQAGNRIVGNWKTKLGQAPSTSEDELDKDAKDLLKRIRASYDKITDGVVAEDKVMTHKKFKAHGIMDTYTEYVLVSAYVHMERNEKQHFARFEGVLEGFNIWPWLKAIPGIHGALAAAIISEFDPHKAKYPSSFWKYAGLDVADDGQGRSRRAEHLIEREYETRNFYCPACELVVKPPRGKHHHAPWDGEAKPELCPKCKEPMVKEISTRNSITFNPWIKSKLMGVLADSFIKQGRAYTKPQRVEMIGMSREEKKKIKPAGEYKSKYAEMYYDYKHRLESNPAHDEKSKGHRHNMAKRYIVKQFLVDLHKEWRALEGLPVSAPYSEAKLGFSHDDEETHKR